MIPIADDSARTSEDAARRFAGLDTWRTGEVLDAIARLTSVEER